MLGLRFSLRCDVAEIAFFDAYLDSIHTRRGFSHLIQIWAP